MQDSSAIYSQIKQPQFPEQEILKCPRCDSINTKFCYYNNYNLSQPRHYCKSCKRYWTKGGTLRNIPVGGGSRKTTKRSSNNKRSSTSSSSSLATLTTAFDQNSPILDVNGPFSSLVASNGPEFGNLLEGLELNGSNLQLGELPGDQSSNSGLFSGLDAAPDDQSGNKIDEYLTVQNGDDSNCWNGSNGWPDLAIYSPGSSFQ